MKKSFLMLGVAVAALASCSNEEVVDMPQSRAIQFETFVNHSTRSSVTETTEENLNKFFVFGNYGEDTWTPVYTNVEVTGGNVGDQSGWNPVQTAYWQSGEKYRFGAYSDGNSKIENENVDFIEGEQKLTFTDYTANNAKDLIVAIPDEKTAQASDNTPVGLSFYHMLSQVKFTFTNTDSHDYIMKIENIKVNAVQTATGTATYKVEKPTIAWETASVPKADYDFETIEDIAEPVKDDSHSTTCFVIPQDNTELSVSFTAIFSDKSGKIAENNFTGKLNYQGDKEGTEKGKWTPGFRYNYTVEINGSKIDPDLKQQVIEFKVDAVEDWTDVDQTPVTPNEVGE